MADQRMIEVIFFFNRMMKRNEEGGDRSSK